MKRFANNDNIINDLTRAPWKNSSNQYNPLNNKLSQDKLKENIKIQNLNLSDKFLEVLFNDGVKTKLTIKSIIKEFSNINDVKFIDKVKWDSTLNDLNNYEFEEGIFEDKKM